MARYSTYVLSSTLQHQLVEEINYEISSFRPRFGLGEDDQPPFYFIKD